MKILSNYTIIIKKVTEKIEKKKISLLTKLRV